MEKRMRKGVFLFLVGVALLSLFSLAVLAQGTSSGNGLRAVFQPIGDALGGLFEIISKDPTTWVKVIIIIVLSTILYLASGILPALKEHERARIVISIAIATGAAIILKGSFLIQLFGAYVALGIALLTGFAVFGSLVLWHTNIHKSASVNNWGKAGKVFSWVSLALMCAALIGLVVMMKDVIISGAFLEGATGATSSAGTQRFAKLADGFMVGLNGLLQLVMFGAGLAAAVVAIAGGAGGAARTYRWAAGADRREQKLEKKEEAIVAAEEAWKIGEPEKVKEAKTALEALAANLKGGKASNESLNTEADNVKALLEKAVGLGEKVHRQAWRNRRIAKKLKESFPDLIGKEQQIGAVAQDIDKGLNTLIKALDKFKGYALKQKKKNYTPWLSDMVTYLGKVIGSLSALIKKEQEIWGELKEEEAAAGTPLGRTV